jgi:DNA-binding MarR family transcriptional regulator
VGETVRPEDFDTLAQFRRGLRRFNAFSEKLNARFGSTQAIYSLMLIIKSNRAAEPPDIGKAASALGLKHHSAAELVQRGEAAGFIARMDDPHDGRRCLLRLTEKGERVISELVALHKAELIRVRADTFDVLERLSP